MFFPNNVSDQSISVFFAGGMRSIPASDPGFAELSAHLALGEHDYETVERLVDKPKMIARLSEGLVQVIGSTVYYKGTPAHSTIAYRLLDILNAGQNAQVWARFLERVMANPSARSRQCLYEFLDAWKAPLTEDGCFITFKRVRADYRDIHSGKFDNSPGQTVEVSRDEVDDDPDETCSYGLHVAATSYLGHHYVSSPSYNTIACKVDPADVVAVPRDYGSAKMRVCKYVVLGDAEESFYNNAESSPIVPLSMTTSDDMAPEVYVDDDFEDEDNEDRICPDCGDYKADWQAICEDCEDARNEEEDIPYCGNCGNVEVDEEDDLCDRCEQEEHAEWQEQWDADARAMEEEDCIAETGCTLNGVPVSDDPSDYDDIPDTEASEMAFMRGGVTYQASEIMVGIANHGQRGYSRMTGIPRTTLQDWTTKIEACE
ncbi:rIIB lysis inhibitor [Ruegeria phage vB_RpoS-V10]|nr:rIIB lysis inhibitor [Roseobacter phage DSS3P8]AWY09216.1 rIIB lysis inhibitor [Ruegeria phage vB_RpoS-V10]